jgi:hypothetical protein
MVTIRIYPTAPLPEPCAPEPDDGEVQPGRVR